MVQKTQATQKGATMKHLKAMLMVMLALLISFAFTNTASAQRVVKDWVVMTYVPDNNYSVPVPLPVTPIKGNGVAFDFYPTPDRAMLVADDLNLNAQFRDGKLLGKTLSAEISIAASPGANFIYFNNDGTGALQDGWADPGGFVRLYFNKVQTPGCPDGWHPERPDCEAQYWWSNPVHIELEDLAALRNGITLEVPLDPSFWSDRDGHMGTDTITSEGITVDHAAAFYAAVTNMKKAGLSFGGNGWWAFGCGVDAPGTATFKLFKFMAK
jgi:hypothetical protein